MNGRKISILLRMKPFGTLAVCAAFAFLASCAGSQGKSSGDPQGDSGCAECGEQGEIELEVTSEKAYREWNPQAYARFDSASTLGSFASLSVEADAPENCRICHSFSADGVDFDLAHYEDSLLAAAFPKMHRFPMLAGSRVPEEDSLFFNSFVRNVQNAVFAGGRKLSDFSPWKNAGVSEAAYARPVPDSLKKMLRTVSLRYNVRYVSMPVRLRVQMFPKAGRSGGFSWESLWILWDARYGELLFLDYQSLSAETTSRIAPERDWASPFAARLGAALRKNPSSVENH